MDIVDLSYYGFERITCEYFLTYWKNWKFITTFDIWRIRISITRGTRVNKNINNWVTFLKLVIDLVNRARYRGLRASINELQNRVCEFLLRIRESCFFF